MDGGGGKDAPPVTDQGSRGMSTNAGKTVEPEAPQAPRPLPEAAKRALQEAAERRAAREAGEAQAKAQAEHGGRAGPDPVRYGDWENGGIASDF